MLVQMAVYGNLSLEDAIYREFMDGGPPTPNHQKLLDSIDWLKKNDLKMGSKSFWYVVGIGWFLNGPSQASFSFIFVFTTNITIFTTNICEKCPSAEIRAFGPEPKKV